MSTHDTSSESQLPTPSMTPRSMASDAQLEAAATLAASGAASPSLSVSVSTTATNHPVAAPSPYASLCPTSVPADFSRISHSFPVVSAQVAAGLQRVKTISDFVRRVCAAKNVYAQDMMKTAAAYATGPSSTSNPALEKTNSSSSSSTGGSHSMSSKLANLLPSSSPSKSHAAVSSAADALLVGAEDSMNGSNSIWGAFQEQLFEEARQEQEYAQKVNDEIVAPMMQFYAEAEKKRKLLVSHHAALSGQMKNLQDSLLQAKINTVKVVQALQQSEIREKESSLASAASADPLAVVPAPSVGQSHGSGKDNEQSNLERSTRKALASVGSFFKGLKDKATSKDKEKDKEASNEGKEKSSKESDSSSSSNNSIANMGLNGGESSEELREKAYQAALSYDLAVASANARQTQFYTTDLPNLFNELEKVEIARLNCLKQYLGLLAAANLSLVSPSKQRLQSLLQSVATLDANGDIREYVDKIVTQVGETQQPNQFQYDLTWTPEAIRCAKMEPQAATAAAAAPVAAASEDVSSSSSSATTSSASTPLFSSSLEDQMDRQESSHPELDVPIAFSTLVQAIRDRKGFNKPNLFFLAADKEAVNQLRAQFEAGNFDTKSVHLDVLASTLKVWLRSLPSPLLPSALYAAAISAVKKDHAFQLTEKQAAHEAMLLAQQAALQAKLAQANASSVTAAQQNQDSTVTSPTSVLALDGSVRTSAASSAAAAATPTSPVPAPDPVADENRPRSSSATSASLAQLSHTLVLSTLPSPQLHQYVQSIFAALPTLNQRILTTLATLLSDIATATSLVSPSFAAAAGAAGGDVHAATASAANQGPFVDANKWALSMSHTASVLSSVVLRNSQADSTELLTNAAKETRFVAALFISVAQTNSTNASKSRSASLASSSQPQLNSPTTTTAVAPTPVASTTGVVGVLESSASPSPSPTPPGGSPDSDSKPE